MQVASIVVGMVQTNCYFLISREKNTAVIDPGAQYRDIVRFLQENGLTPRMILLTHGHFDHIGGVNGLRETYPDLPVYIGAEDAEMLTDPRKSCASMMGGPGYRVEKFETLREGGVLTLDELTIQMYATPGHSKGSLTYQVGDCLFTGDALFAGDIGRTDLYGGDYDTLIQSVKKLYRLPGDYRVLPGHGPQSTLERERRTNYYVRAEE